MEAGETSGTKEGVPDVALLTELGRRLAELGKDERLGLETLPGNVLVFGDVILDRENEVVELIGPASGLPDDRGPVAKDVGIATVELKNENGARDEVVFLSKFEEVAVPLIASADVITVADPGGRTLTVELGGMVIDELLAGLTVLLSLIDEVGDPLIETEVRDLKDVLVNGKWSELLDRDTDVVGSVVELLKAVEFEIGELETKGGSTDGICVVDWSLAEVELVNDCGCLDVHLYSEVVGRGVPLPQVLNSVEFAAGLGAGIELDPVSVGSEEDEIFEFPLGKGGDDLVEPRLAACELEITGKDAELLDFVVGSSAEVPVELVELDVEILVFKDGATELVLFVLSLDDKVGVITGKVEVAKIVEVVDDIFPWISGSDPVKETLVFVALVIELGLEATALEVTRELPVLLVDGMGGLEVVKAVFSPETGLLVLFGEPAVLLVITIGENDEKGVVDELYFNDAE